MKNSSLYTQVLDEIALLNEAGNEFSRERIARGQLTPVFFGSALTSFGVQTFLETYLEFAPPPQPRHADIGDIDPLQEEFSGFIFKIQANMNPNHRDRIAFVRICSGRFTKGMTVTLARTGKPLKLSQSTQFLASDRINVDEAVAGDIIGLYDTGKYQIGDTLVAGKKVFHFDPLPRFTPELFARVTAKNVMKQKQFYKGIHQLVQEGAIQLYKTKFEDFILGAVGQLQFEVFATRMKNEYNVDVVLEPMGSRVANWVKNGKVDEKLNTPRSMLVNDRDGNPVFLFENEFAMRWFMDKHPEIELYNPMDDQNNKE